MVDLAAIAVAVTTALAPFTPYLVEVGKTATDKLAETIASKGGEAAWQKAQGLWAKITARFEGDAEVEDAATALATKPDSDLFRKMMSELLAVRLQQDPRFTSDLVALLGGEAAVQQVVAGQEAQIRNIQQTMAGRGTQTVQGGDRATIEGVRQEQGG